MKYAALEPVLEHGRTDLQSHIGIRTFMIFVMRSHGTVEQKSDSGSCAMLVCMQMWQ